MNLKIFTFEHKDLPKLAWVASHDLTSKKIFVNHGSAVECHNDWIVEGVWDEDFELGNFHQSENFFGSGIRIDGNKVYFVTSTALVDRLIYCRFHQQLIVSNSLVVLMAFTRAKLDLNHDYRLESFTILKGIKKYEREFTILHPEIECFYQVFHHNLVVSNGKISFSNRTQTRQINSFPEYYDLMIQALHRIKENYESDKRKFAVSTFSTASSGYDSTAVSSLVRKIGVKTCFTSRKSNSILPTWLSPKTTIDDGGPVARKLGFETKYLNHSNTSEDELYFLAASCAGPELIYYSMSQHIYSNCQVGVVFTGYHGDVAWDIVMKHGESGDEIIRGDTSGFNLSEIRLKSGFIHVAVPFMYSRSIKYILNITHSNEMTPWRLNNNYDRPIPRRIVEESDVPRNFFGFRKKGVTKYYSYPKNTALRRKFFEFLKREYNITPHAVYAYDVFIGRLSVVSMGVSYHIRLGKLIDKNYRFGLYLSQVMFIWAANSLSDIMTARMKWPDFTSYSDD